MQIAIVGIGYVGLQLAIEFGKIFRTIAYDNSKQKIKSYRNFNDPNGEISSEEIKAAKNLKFSLSPKDFKKAKFIIVAVPTPVKADKTPDLSFIKSASKVVGKNLKKGSIVVYEPTVYPGVTEEVCVPILEKFSGLKWKKDFNVGYSPERINPGDKNHSLKKIVKIVSGDNQKCLDAISELYEKIVTAGVYKASSIKIAEAAKVIENTQRDLNIALVNELSIIFNKIGLDTQKVLEASETKWNFISFQPGLVGGHCIGVDPYYLTFMSKKIGYNPKVILSGREINDNMAFYIANEIIKKVLSFGYKIKGLKVIVLGLTFKENCSDLRNSKVVDLVVKLKDFGCKVLIHDPLVKSFQSKKIYGLPITLWENLEQADVIIAAVPHKSYLEIPLDDILKKLKNGGFFVDIKSSFPENEILNKNYKLWRL